MPKVSVIVTNYNRKDILAETIHSILNQTFTDFELIVVDNFSDYDFFEHINSFNDTRIRAFQNQNNGIIAVNRNFGIKKAKGEYIAFCDDDDTWAKNKLEVVIDHIKKNRNAILFCHYENLIKGGVFTKTLKHGKKIKSDKNLYEQLLFKGNQVSTSAVVVKKDNALDRKSVV